MSNVGVLSLPTQTDLDSCPRSSDEVLTKTPRRSLLGIQVLFSPAHGMRGRVSRRRVDTRRGQQDRWDSPAMPFAALNAFKCISFLAS
jgi:hypothetical protein